MNHNNDYNKIETQQVPTYPDMRLLNVEQVADILGINRVTVYKLINTNKIKSVRVNSRRLFTNRAVQKYITSLEEADET